MARHQIGCAFFFFLERKPRIPIVDGIRDGIRRWTGSLGSDGCYVAHTVWIQPVLSVWLYGLVVCSHVFLKHGKVALSGNLG